MKKKKKKFADAPGESTTSPLTVNRGGQLKKRVAGKESVRNVSDVSVSNMRKR